MNDPTVPPTVVPPEADGLRLVALRPGEQGVVVAVLGGDALAQRLVDQGLWAGVAVEMVTAALGGDPVLVRLHGYRLALRRDEAARVVLAGGAR